MKDGPILDPQSAFRLNMEQCLDRSRRFNREVVSAPEPLAKGRREPTVIEQDRVPGLVRRALDWTSAYVTRRLG